MEKIEEKKENLVEEKKEPSKAAVKKEIAKKQRKKAQGIAVLTQSEKKKYEELVTNEPRKTLFVLHFGNGDEEDQTVLLNYVKQFGEVDKLFIFPGVGYGYLRFKDVESAQKLVAQCEDNCCELKFFNKPRCVFFLYTNEELSQLEKFKKLDVPNATYHSDIPGLIIINDFLNEEEEKQLIKDIDSNKWTKLLNRKVQHYGYEFIYGANTIDKHKKIGPLPAFCDVLQPRLKKALKEFELNQDNEAVYLGKEAEEHSYYAKYEDFDQLTINDYLPGQGIPPHYDTHSPFEEVFASLSLKSGATMNFKTYEGDQRNIYLQPRSLALFSGEARYRWLHSIALRKVDLVEGLLKFRQRRVSLTFRKIRFDPCKCRWKECCDSQATPSVPKDILTGGERVDTIEEYKDATAITDMEKKHVYDVYERIAPHFSHTRYKPWPQIKEYLESLPIGSLNCDVGCGNGKYLGVNSENVYSIGTDRSFNFVDICKERGFQSFVCDSQKLPIREGAFDSVISIAVIHHFSNRTLRVNAIRELTRILKVGGKLLIYVWAFEQEEKKFEAQDVFVPWHLQNNYEGEQPTSQTTETSEEPEKPVGNEEIKEGEEEKKQGEGEETKDPQWFIKSGYQIESKNARIYHRYYHVFKQGELEDIVKEAGNLEIEKSYYDHANWCVRCTKLG